MTARTSLSRALTQALAGGARLAMFRRASRSSFLPSPELFALLFVFDLLLLFAFAFATVGPEGHVNLYEVPRVLMFVPLVLALGLLARHVDGAEILRLPVALTAAGIPITVVSWALYLFSQYQWVPYVATYWAVIDYGTMAWWAAVIVAATLWLLDGPLRARLLTGATGAVLLVSPAILIPAGLLWAPDYDENRAYATASFHTLAEEGAFYAQDGALERELEALSPQRAGVVDVYVVAAGLYAGEDVFMKDVQLVTGLLDERFDAAGRTVRLINNPKTVQDYPIASLTSVTEALRRVGEVMNVEEDVLLLYLTSHGSEKHELAVDFRPIRFAPIDPAALKSALEQSGIRWKIVIVSACYSGGFVEPLKDERTLIITAARADRQSFGCGSESESTYLARALFGEALRKTLSLEAAFAQARATIERWEREKGYTPSEPQLYVGSQMRAKLAELERRLRKR